MKKFFIALAALAALVLGAFFLARTVSIESRPFQGKLAAYHVGRFQILVPENLKLEAGKIRYACGAGESALSVVEIPHPDYGAAAYEALKYFWPEAGALFLADLSPEAGRPAQFVISGMGANQATAVFLADYGRGTLRISAPVARKENGDFEVASFTKEALELSRNYQWGQWSGTGRARASLNGEAALDETCRLGFVYLPFASEDGAIRFTILLDDSKPFTEAGAEHYKSLTATGFFDRLGNRLMTRLARRDATRFKEADGLEAVYVKTAFFENKELCAFWLPRGEETPGLSLIASPEKIPEALGLWNAITLSTIERK